MAEIITDQNTIDTINSLLSDLNKHRAANRSKEAIYTAKRRLRDLGVVIPPEFRKMKVSIGWPATAINTLSNRVTLTSFISENEDLDVMSIYDENDLAAESDNVHLDSFIFGTSYVIVGNGDPEDPFEPGVLVTVESPNNVVSRYNPRTRRLDYALHVVYENEENYAAKPKFATLYSREDAITFDFTTYGAYEVTDVWEHNLGIVPVIQFVNRRRASKRASKRGSSEITEVMTNLYDMALRSMARMEISAEFFSMPQKYILHADKKEFMDKDGNPIDLISSYANAMMILAGQQNVGVTGETETSRMQVGQFMANSPEPFLKMLDWYASQAASEAGQPATYYGQDTANPASADAIVKAEIALIQKAERVAKSFAKEWSEVMTIAAWVRDGAKPESKITAVFADPSTPTKAATADANVKYVGVGTLQADSEVVLDDMRLTEEQKKIVRKENRAARANGLVETLRTNAQQVREQDPVLSQIAEQG